MRKILDHAPLETGVPSIDQAYTLVTERLMDALVVRDAPGPESDRNRPATMILAGNQYFHDTWKRDENIALGFLLAQGRYDLARDVIADTWQQQDPRTGRLPQRLRVGEPPQYHSSDGTLWALKRLHDYWRNTGDDSLLRDKLPMVELFFQRSLDRTVRGLLPSGRTDDPDYLWETWMDTPYTPRDGFPVEIQMLWISALRHYRPVFASVNPSLEASMASVEAEAWEALMGYMSRGVPADSLDETGRPRDLITPNPYFSFGLGLDLGPAIERAMLRMGRQELAGQRGIVTLAPSDWPIVFTGEFLSDRHLVRGRRMRSAGKFNYHRGLEWNWLTRFFVEAELKYGEAEAAYRTYLRKQVRAVLEVGGVGGISELHDLSGPRGPEFQTWSMAGFVEGLHSFTGVRIDVPGRCISIAPQLPRLWPRLSARKWYATTPFDLRFSRVSEGLELTIDFPDGAPRDASLDVGLVVPRGGRMRRRGVSVNEVPAGESARVEPLPGTDRLRVRLTIPAEDHLRVLLPLRAGSSVSRVPAPA
jgi:glycogen debranching enzyme